MLGRTLYGCGKLEQSVSLVAADLTALTTFNFALR